MLGIFFESDTFKKRVRETIQDELKIFENFIYFVGSTYNQVGWFIIRLGNSSSSSTYKRNNITATRFLLTTTQHTIHTTFFPQIKII
jgi:hypothetical protein